MMVSRRRGRRRRPERRDVPRLATVGRVERGGVRDEIVARAHVLAHGAPERGPGRGRAGRGGDLAREESARPHGLERGGARRARARARGADDDRGGARRGATGRGGGGRGEDDGGGGRRGRVRARVRRGGAREARKRRGGRDVGADAGGRRRRRHGAGHVSDEARDEARRERRSRPRATHGARARVARETRGAGGRGVLGRARGRASRRSTASARTPRASENRAERVFLARPPRRRGRTKKSIRPDWACWRFGSARDAGR